MKTLPLITAFIMAATTFHTALPASIDIPTKEVAITKKSRTVKYTGSYNGRLVIVEATFKVQPCQLTKLTGSNTQDLNELLQRFKTLNNQYLERYRFCPQPDLPKS